MSNIHNGGFLLYKCRLCGAVYQTGTHAPNVFNAVIGAYDEHPMMSKTCFHVCKDGRCGLADFVGGVPDKEEAKS